ncbi:MAG TPA: NmrA family NAD(P)-binding protein [Acidobacteriaceae bacterium]|nr:NmrA family NAD(P)-binding protein [Acidobacteriaceae bacterium]
MQNAPKILAIGAAGKFAGMVIPELVERGAIVRGFIHDGAQESLVRKHGAAETMVGDLTDRASVDRAVKDVDGVFYIAPAFLPNEADVGVAMVEAAKRAGVRRFVFSSVIHPILSALGNHEQKAPVEEALLTSGMEYTFLHPTVFFQNFTESWSRIVATGVLAEPWSIDSRFSHVDYRDVAEAAAIALTGDQLLYGTFELCAEGWHDRKDVAEIISGVLGRRVTAARVDPKKAAAAAGPGAPALEKMFDWYDQRGLKGSALTLRAVLGREPRTLRAFFEELASASKTAA